MQCPEIWNMTSNIPELELQMAEALCGCWKLNLGPLEEHLVPLTTEPPSNAFDLFYKEEISARVW